MRKNPFGTPDTRPAGRGRSRLVLVAATAAVALGLAACGSGSTGSTASGSGGSSGSKKVYALISGTNVPYLATYADTMKTKATALGLQLTVLSADFDASKQAQQFDQAIAQKPAVIIVAAVDATAVVPSLLKAKQANIPVVASNTGVDASGTQYTAGFTGPNDELEGQEAAKLMATAVNKTGSVAIVEGALGTTAQINRSKGFTEQLAKDAPGVKILGKQTGAWDKDKARTAAAAFITRFGTSLTAIFAEDDTMASGVAQAVSDAGKASSITVVGLGGSTQGFDGIKDGSIYGTIIQSPKQDAEYAAQAAADLIAGKTLPATNYLKPISVTKDNVSQYTAEW